MAEEEAKKWTRETSWRQGHLLPADALAHFGLSHVEDAAATCAVVITHDCDLANDNLEQEPEVEVVVGRFMAAANGNFTWAKAPRTLHYFADRSGAPVVVELVATAKRRVSKVELANFEPDAAIKLDVKALATLRNWLGARYNRAAFPDEFVRRMGALKADQKLVKALDKRGELISFVYFDLDGGGIVERPAGDPYQLNVVLVYTVAKDADEAGDEADSFAAEVDEALRSRLKGHEDQIVLKSCFAVSEEELPVSQARLLTQWRLEHMTLKADGEQTGAPSL